MAQIHQVVTDTARGSTTIEQRVVVVVDGSARSIEALRGAVERAQRIGAVVDLVCALDIRVEDDTARRMHRYRDTYGPGQVMPQPDPPNPPEPTARENAERCVRRAFPNGRPKVPLRIWISQPGAEPRQPVP